jgi:hypothetical protein
LVTLSAKSVTITKSQVIATGEIVLVYYFQAHVKTEGWSVNQPGTIPSHSGAITIDFRNSQGGTVWGDTIYLNFNCGVDNQQFQSKRIPIDVFDLIQGVHLGPTAQDYWHC